LKEGVMKIAAYDPGGKLCPLKKVRRKESYLTLIIFALLAFGGGYILFSSEEKLVARTAETLPRGAIYCLSVESLQKVLSNETLYGEREQLFEDGECNGDGGIRILPTGSFKSFTVSYSIAGNVSGTNVILAEGTIENFVPLEKGIAGTVHYVARNFSNVAYATK
jgi:hypothetical protein